VRETVVRCLRKGTLPLRRAVIALVVASLDSQANNPFVVRNTHD
jgi:hypothetical protein